MNGVKTTVKLPGLDIIFREWAAAFGLKPCESRADDNWDAYKYGSWLIRVTRFGDEKGVNTIELGTRVLDGVIPDWLQQLIQKFQEVYMAAQLTPPKVHVNMVYVYLR